MKRMMALALLTGATLAHAQSSPAKKELVQKLLTLQQPGIEQMAVGLVERPAAQMLQEASRVLQSQVPPENREAVGKQIQADVKQYADESVPLVRERAIKLAPTAIGSVLEDKLTEDDLKQIIAWFESPVNKKYQQLAPEMQDGFVQKLIVDARPLIDPKLKALEQKVRATLNTAVTAGASAAPSSAAGPKPAASGAKGAVKK